MTSLPIAGQPVGKIFVPGGLPTVTYNPRPELRLEQQVQDYSDERHRVLSVSGPTKTGKTTLLKSMLRDAIWLTGGSIKTVDEFWAQTADRLGLFTDEEVEHGTSSDIGFETEISGGVPGIVSGSTGGSAGWGSAAARRQGRARPTSSVARERLLETNAIVVVDDFHYISASAQEDIVRAMKELVFEGVGLVVAAVPHRAYDVVRVEKEMTGRVQQLQVGFWSDDQLRNIASTGFSAMNALDSNESLAERLATESFNSPHLMQDFCLELCKTNGFRNSLSEPLDLVAPDWPTFFSGRASQTSKTAFDLLVRGPRQRTDRKARKLKSGQTVDIYGAVLAAIAQTGPKTQITYEQIRSGLREVMQDDAPGAQEVTRILGEMVKIAQSDMIVGEPVVDYDNTMSTLYISDPYFAYYLRWGTPDYQVA